MWHRWDSLQRFLTKSQERLKNIRRSPVLTLLDNTDRLRPSHLGRTNRLGLIRAAASCAGAIDGRAVEKRRDSPQVGRQGGSADRRASGASTGKIMKENLQHRRPNVRVGAMPGRMKRENSRPCHYDSCVSRFSRADQMRRRQTQRVPSTMAGFRRAEDLFGFHAEHTFREGLKKTK